MREKNQLAEYKKYIEDSLPGFLPTGQLEHSRVIEAMRYSLCSGGKRVRGMLTMLFYELFGGQSLDEAIPFAASVEMIHAYSLIHDDLPCMDDDDLRRGLPSCHIKFGEDVALLAGDGLLTLAFETISSPKYISESNPEVLIKIIKAISSAVGTEGMIGGQVLDLENESKPATIHRVEKTVLMKTGALISISGLIGAMLSGANEKEQQTVAEYGRALGLAFQVIDDILDTTSTAEVLGKPIGSDAENNKTTYTRIYGVEKAKNIAENQTKKALTLLKSLSKDSKLLEKFTMQLVERNY